MTDIIVCDFCAERPAPRVYKTKNFIVTMISYRPIIQDKNIVDNNMGENWAACETCGDLLDQGNWEDLLKRVVGLMKKEFGLDYTDFLRTAWAPMQKNGVTRIK